MATIAMHHTSRIDVYDVAGGRVRICVAERHARPTAAVGGGPRDGLEYYSVLVADTGSGDAELSERYRRGRLPEDDLLAALDVLGDEEGLTLVTVNGMQVWPEPVLDTTI